MNKITLTPAEPIDFVQFLISNNLVGENYMCSIIEHGTHLDQIIPSVYLRQNNFFKYDFTCSIQGMVLFIISNKLNFTFALEFHEEIFERDYDVKNSKLSKLITVDRKDIFWSKKNGKVKFNAVNPKKTLKVMNGIRAVPKGGFIPGLLIRAIFTGVEKLEKDLIEKTGTLFVLCFNHLGRSVELELVVDDFYTIEFEEFLKIHWSKESPAKISSDSGGCYIATACYGDYNHPYVIQLRYFRDAFLQKRKWGLIFIKFYYRYSPSLARTINKYKILKFCSKNILVSPLYHITKFFMIKK